MDEKIRRFSTARIVEHWVHMIVFTVLVMTGLSQKYYAFNVSLWFIMHLGGIDTIRFIHRCTGVFFTVSTTLHVAVALFGVVVKRWQPSMVITQNDFKNAVHNIKYYLGSERHPANAEKYNYTQKFEYWGILTGGLLMIATGAMLWQPLFITRFLSGEFIPAAKVLHSNEALVVILIIAIWHIYNAMFSPEVFPLDISIFTGFITRERMVYEHILELARREHTTPDEIRARHHDGIVHDLSTRHDGHAGSPDA